MELPKTLLPLVDRIVCSELPKFRKQKAIGLLFDGSALNRNQRGAIFEQFGDSERSHFLDLVVWGDEDDDNSWGPKAFRDDCMPFMLWQPDELFDDRAALLKKLTNNVKKKTKAFDGGEAGFASFPQYQQMWFLHRDGHVTFAEVDGSFMPKKKSSKLVGQVGELRLRLATPADVDL